MRFGRNRIRVCDRIKCSTRRQRAYDVTGVRVQNGESSVECSRAFCGHDLSTIHVTANSGLGESTVPLCPFALFKVDVV